MTAPRLFTVLAALIPLLAVAQSGDDTAPPPNWYAVEVVIFDQRGSAGDDGERWPADPTLPAAVGDLTALAPAGGTTAAFTRLPGDALELAGIRQRLAGTGGYRVIGHFGWRQPGLDATAAPAVALPLDWLPPPAPALPEVGVTAALRDNPFARVPGDTRLLGRLRVYRSRYLHVETDLRYAPQGWGPATGGDAKTGVVYPVHQERRLRSGELHYLDHPALGIIVQIRELEAPVAEHTPDADTAPEAPVPDDGDAAGDPGAADTPATGN